MVLECSLCSSVFRALDEVTTTVETGDTPPSELELFVRLLANPVSISLFVLVSFMLGYILLFKILNPSSDSVFMSMNYSIRRLGGMLVILVFGAFIFALLIWVGTFGGLWIPTDPNKDAFMILLLGAILGVSLGSYVFLRKW